MDKETTEFSRGSFKEKILRQLEENAAKQAETKFPDPEDFERPSRSDSEEPERKIEPRKVDLEPFKLPVFDFPAADENEEEPFVENENLSEEGDSLRQNLDGVVSEEIQNQDIPPQFSRSESKVQDEKVEQEQFSEKKNQKKWLNINLQEEPTVLLKKLLLARKIRIRTKIRKRKK